MFTSAGKLQGTGGVRSDKDPFWNQVSMLLLGVGPDGGIIIGDEKGKAVTRVGNPVIETSDPPPNMPSSIQFNGTSYLTLPPGDDFRVGLGDYTMDAWIRHEDSAHTNFMGFCNPGSPAGIIFQIKADGCLAISTYVSQYLQSFTDPVPLNEWKHVECSRSAGTSRLFMHGKLVATYGNDLMNMTDGVAAIGATIAGLGPLVGKISNARFTRGARHTSDFTPPPPPFPIA